MRIVPAVRIGLTALGVVLVVGAFLGVTLVGSLTSPPPLRIAVAVRDLQPGEPLNPDAYKIEQQVMNPSLARLYVQESELPDYASASVVDVIRRGDPLNKVKLATSNGDAALRRYALVLTDTNDVVMTLPVNPDVIPSQVAAGDFVNLIFAAGADVGINKLPDPTETPRLDGYNQGVTTPVPRPPSERVATAVPTLTLTPAIVLPLADLMLEHVPVLDVNHEQVRNPNYGVSQTDNEPPYLEGPLTSIVVRVRRAYQTLLGFAAVTGKLRFTISSPLMQAHAIQPGAGVDWKAYIDAYRWKVQQSVDRGETLTQTLFPDYVPPTPRDLALPELPTARAPALTASPVLTETR